MGRVRLDKLVVKRGLAADVGEAQQLIEDSRIRVAGILNANPRSQVDGGADIKLIADGPSYVSRGAHKLVRGLEAFGIDPKGMVAMDVGASTGGFTDVLLQRGAQLVFAVDVGYGQLAWPLRQDKRVVVLERENIRTIGREKITQPVDLAVIDVSFISLSKILENVAMLMQGSGKSILALIKPQFEARKDQVGKGGVVRDEGIRQQCIDNVVQFAEGKGFVTGEVVESPIRGPAGNIEFLIELKTPHQGSADGLLRKSSDGGCADPE